MNTSNPRADSLGTGLLTAIGAGLGAAGAITLPLDLSPILWIIPMGLGIAGAVMLFGSLTRKEDHWLAPLGFILCLIAIGSGIDAYSEFQDAADAFRDL